jgi:hypothetical protein
MSSTQDHTRSDLDEDSAPSVWLPQYYFLDIFSEGIKIHSDRGQNTSNRDVKSASLNFSSGRKIEREDSILGLGFAAGKMHLSGNNALRLGG